MTLGLVFWILMLLWLLFGAWGTLGRPGWPYFWQGHGLLLFILLLLLGWASFGAPIRA